MEQPASAPERPPSHPGEAAMRALLHAVDWTRSPVGAPRQWSPALRGTIGAILAARVQIVLFWGVDYTAFYNSDYAPTIGDKHPRALGRPARENWAELWDDLGPLLDKVRIKGETVTAADRSFHIERNGFGEEFFFDISYSPVRELDGSIGGVLCIVNETTDRVRAQRKAVAERARLALMFEQAPGFMALLAGPDHVFELTNAAYQQLIGHRAVIGLPLARALPEVVAQGFVRLLDEVYASGQRHVGNSVAVTLQRLPGGSTEERMLDFIFQPIVGADGKVDAVFVQGSDVTERVRAEQKLAVSESRARMATAAADVGTWDLDLVNETLEWDSRTRAAFGIASDAPNSMRDFYDGLHPEDAPATGAAFARALDPKLRETYDVEYRTIGRDDGVIRWVAAKGRGVFVDNVCVRAIGTAIDITRQKRATEALRESEERFRSLADSAPALIWQCDTAGAMIFANRWHEEMFGRPADALAGAAWQDVIHPDDVAGFAEDFDAAFAVRESFSRDVRVIDRHGAIRWLHSEARPRFVERDFTGYVGCDVDVTEARLAAEALERGIAERTGELAATNRQLSAQIEERERVEATLRQMQRLEAVGQLTAGVAHDFNNLLTVVLGNAGMIEQSIGEEGDARLLRRLRNMRMAAERGAALTAQLLAFSRRQRLEARATDLNEAVKAMRDLLQSSMGGSVQLSIELGEMLWPALVDATQIELIILNLAINARDAMAVGGSLTVETANVTLGEPAAPEEPPAGDYVMIAVADSGTGMTPDVLAKAFEPFFTTKPVGKGSGLGLAQVFGFARQSGGGVGIETQLGEGTTVRVYLPRSADAVTPGEEARPDSGDNRAVAGKRVLLVDDDGAVREVTATLLRDMGCEVTEADGGPAALNLLADRDGQFDLAVVDFAMPGMNGAEIAAVASEHWPSLPILFATGFADLSAIASVSDERIVQKPFQGGELQRKARAALAAALP